MKTEKNTRRHKKTDKKIHKSNSKNKKGIWIICGLSCVLFVLLILIFVGMRFGRKEPESYDFEEPSSEEASTEETSEEASGEEAVIYPEPEYDFKTEEVTLALPGIEKEYTIAWVSDLHLISDHEAGKELGDVHAEYLDAIEKRYEELPVAADGTHAEELWPEIIKYLNYHEFDGIIFGGDIMDYCSNSNIAMIKEGLDSLHAPYMYVRADHDYGAYYGGIFFTEAEARGLHQSIDGDQISQKFWDMGDFIVLGIDHSTKDMPDYYLNMVADVYSRGKPVVMATHVPYESMTDTSLADLSMQVRNTIYYWSDASERYRANDITKKYLAMVYSEDTVVRQVLGGHLHASWDGMISEIVSEHIFTPAYTGTIGILHVVPET